MSHSDEDDFTPGERGRVLAPWERAFDRVLTPFEEFVHRESTAGLLLMATAVLALVAANSPLAAWYEHLRHLPVGLSVGGWTLEKTLHHWINDGLMTLFFFVVGLELKRAFLVGELAEPRQAVLPILAALGGMLVPALLYFLLNASGDEARGWGIPMATDIAFALGTIALLAGRVPQSLIMFLVALAIVDDLGAVVVIALFYTDELVVRHLVEAGVLTGLLVVMNRIGVRTPLPYFLLGLLLWLALLKSGVHATLAGVITAFTIPAIPRFDPRAFRTRMQTLLDRFGRLVEEDPNVLRNVDMKGTVQTMENGILGVETPLQRLEHGMHGWVAFLVLPVFAFFNAGIPIAFDQLGSALVQPVTLGVVAGLLAGKFLGIAGITWLAVRLGIARLPQGTHMVQLVGVALLGGIGFTMSIFIAELAFAHQPALVLQAKLGILAASLVAGVGGYLWLRLVSAPAKVG